ncbi:aminoacyl-tRNA deacylase [Pollutimonas thiosulfatoxidans]|uniref:Cys-tRNA(Pro)/Cys-tRNA(Cys) deacylase n=1 Tax=Pollutimonas thiosulfatoxidans TaxID=2028345 RepID=A0A410GCP7_9BURK|nr:aminoacyl-tRNA deacylase [Pollutimonas thiosulfatoxidans]NYT44425.1 aminoacyl-tRNA deacylase [Alcaligenaceae bacterium]QAA94034.1 Cys-tRNA(Pro) deacylase [Pollutimonas thiosulfatoxidans]
MTKEKHVSETPATQLLRRSKVVFTEHTYHYVDHGGAGEAARQLGLDPHQVGKTLIMEDENAKPLVVLMHGDCEVSTKNLARQTGAKRINPCSPDVAQKHSGYLVGGTSPFATRKKMPVWIEAGLLAFPKIYVNGGRRGYLIGVDPAMLASLLGAKTVTASLPMTRHD